MVLSNSGADQTVTLQMGTMQAEITLARDSVATLLWD
jgi:hypothetical protein